MGQPRARRRAVVVISSDEEDGYDDTDDLLKEEIVEETKPPTRASTRAKAKPPKPVKAESTPPPDGSQSSQRSSSKASKPDSKKSKGTIFSFFNAATQKQQTSQEPTGSQKVVRAVPTPSTEDIDDAIDEDDTTIELTGGSKTSMTHRKRKFGIEQFAVGETSSIQTSSQKFRKTADGAKVVARPQVEDKRPWTEQYGPVDLLELAVHKKKVSDVRALLEEAVSVRARPRVIVLKGAAGTGKTTTIQLLAKDLGIEIKEWRNPGSVEFGSENSTSASAQFEDFILRSGKYNGLDLVSGGMTGVDLSRTPNQEAKTSVSRAHIMLIEEFPNTFAKSSGVLQSFRSTIQQYLAMPRYSQQTIAPIVMLISETLLSTSTAASDSFTTHRLLGPAILTHPLTAEIEFNSVATTFLTKALELVVIKEARKSGRRKTPGPQVLKQLAETGDVRSAISSLEFLCLRGDDDDAWTAKVAFSKPKGKAAKNEMPLTMQEKEALKLISNRESTLGIFHSVGKVVYNKRTDPSTHGVPQPPSHLPQHRRPKLPETDADALIVELGTDTPTFVAALHENFALSCTTTMADYTMDSLNGCLESLSDADMLAPDRFGQGSRNYTGSTADSLRQDEISFQVAVRGLLFNLPYPVKRDMGPAGKKGDAFRMFYPTSLKTWKRQEEIEGMLDLVGAEYAATLGANAVATGAKKEGVEGWRRNADTGLPTPADDDTREEQDTVTKPLLLTSSAKQEMLLERLPFMAQILPSTASSPFHERVRTITSFDGHSVSANEDETEDETEDRDSPDANQSEWTDRPDADGDAKPPRRKDRGQGRSKLETEGGGLNIPVEHAVERLVLSDDDIED